MTRKNCGSDPTFISIVWLTAASSSSCLGLTPTPIEVEEKSEYYDDDENGSIRPTRQELKSPGKASPRSRQRCYRVRHFPWLVILFKQHELD